MLPTLSPGSDGWPTSRSGNESKRKAVRISSVSSLPAGLFCLLAMGRILCLCLWLVYVLSATAGEVRGVWVDRSTLANPEEIRTMMQSLAAANMNAAFVNVWSRGYPLWQSDVFESETGLRIDPGFDGRDPLQECIDAAKPFGIAVIPWFEYGFVGGWSGYRAGTGGRGVIFDAHPEWLARNSAGQAAFPITGGGSYFWMAHTRPEVQEFLFRMTAELAMKYAIPAIQFDRARYPSLDCGYDDYTKELYASEHEGQQPPAKGSDAAWLRWRADKLNEFHLKLSRRIKAADWRVLVTDAPTSYPYGYVNFAQDYPAWVKAGSVDFITPQLYFGTAEQYDRELSRQISQVDDASRIVPGVDITNSRNPDVLIKMIQSTRNRGLGGVIIWYYGALAQLGAFDRLRASVYSEPASLPWRSVEASSAVPAQ